MTDARTLGLIASFQRAVVDDLKTKNLSGCGGAWGRRCILVSGGVAANRELRERFTAEAARVAGLPISLPVGGSLHRQRGHDSLPPPGPSFLAGEFRIP